MKKVRFLKNHLQYTANEEAEIDVPEARLKYWCNVGVCEALDGSSSTNNDGGFDPVARTKELNKLNRDKVNDVALKLGLDPLSYSNKTKAIEAIVIVEGAKVETNSEDEEE